MRWSQTENTKYLALNTLQLIHCTHSNTVFSDMLIRSTDLFSILEGPLHGFKGLHYLGFGGRRLIQGL